MRLIEPITLVLDLIGLILVCLNLFCIPEPIKFTFNQEYGVIIDPQPFADAINSISRNIALIRWMRWGFVILVISLTLKLVKWFIGYFSKRTP